MNQIMSSLFIATDLLKHSAEIARCYKDPFYFATNYCHTQKTESDKELIALYPQWAYLGDTLYDIRDARGDHLWDKSRQMLLTWTFAVYELHQLLFTEGYHAFNLSRKAQLVDDGGANSTPYSIHGRIRFIWERLPKWLKSPMTFAQLKITNDEPGMDGLIIGESANTNAGRSGSYVDVFADEMASVPQGELVHASLSGCTYRTRHYVSTPKSGDNLFTRLRKDEASGFKIHTLMWDLRPDRNQKWYKRKAASMLPWQRAQELDINYEGAQEDRIYPHYHEANIKVKDEDLPSNQHILHHIGGKDWGFSQQGVLLEAIVDLKGDLWVIAETAAKHVHIEQRNGQGQLDDNCWIRKAQQADLGLLVAGHESPDKINKFVENNIRCQPRRWDFEQGIMEVSKLLDGAESNRLYIHESCTTLLNQLPLHIWQRNAFGELTTNPVKRHDHAPDALRYLVEAYHLVEDAWVYPLKPLEKP